MESWQSSKSGLFVVGQCLRPDHLGRPSLPAWDSNVSAGQNPAPVGVASISSSRYTGEF